MKKKRKDKSETKEKRSFKTIAEKVIEKEKIGKEGSEQETFRSVASQIIYNERERKREQKKYDSPYEEEFTKNFTWAKENEIRSVLQKRRQSNGFLGNQNRRNSGSNLKLPKLSHRKVPEITEVTEIDETTF